MRRAIRSLSEDASKTLISPGVRLLPPGLLQLAVLSPSEIMQLDFDIVQI